MPKGSYEVAVLGAAVNRLANLRIAMAGLMVLAFAFTAFGQSGWGATVRSSRSGPGSRAAGAPESGPAPLLGVVGASEPNFAQEAAAGVDSVTISVGWNEAEPDSGTFSTSYIQGVNDEIAAAGSAGLSVVLDPGLQYPPDWVFSLPGGTRFVDQYGDVFTGTEASGNDVANAVTDMAVRDAESSYLAWLGSQIPGSSLVAVRQGGGPLGELRYPDGSYNGHTNCYWAYDASTQSVSPVPGWVPGTGSTAQATSFLNAYNAELDDYGVWLNGQLASDFGSTELVMLPGWGERPGGAAAETASLLTLDMDEFNQGLDWTDLLGSLPDAAHSVAYTTYLDAPTEEPTPQLEDPADYLATLVAGTPVRLGGENTGDGTVADMDLCIERALSLHFFIVQWMDEAQLISSDQGQDPDGPTMAELGAAMGSPSPGVTPPSITTTSLPTAVVGGSYSATLTIADGEAPFTWSVTGGSLPTGLSLDSDGTISGSPTVAGRSTFTVGATGAPAAGNQASAALVLTVGAPDPPAALTLPVEGIASTPNGGGYWLAAADGGVEAVGDATYFGSMAGTTLTKPINHIVATPEGGGYWLVASDGGIFSFGDARFFGSMGGKALNAPVVGLAATPDGGGYWLVALDGGVFSFGDARFFGSMGGQHLNRPVVGIATDNQTGGYWLVASDGGIFSFGAPFLGSTGALTLDQPIDGMATTTGGAGYWLVASDGGIFSFGDATFRGSAVGSGGGVAVGMATDPSSPGYWIADSGGQVEAEDASV
jgi:Putative Ig domain